MEWVSFLAVSLAAFVAASLTLYSGFGLGTLMLPVFALFLPVEMAVVATALVHGANNVFKVSLLGRHADRDVILRFGLPAVIAAVLGALMLGMLAGVSGGEAATSGAGPLKVTIGLMMIAFALFEVLPAFSKLAFERRWLPLGGLLSGFFGGLSGHQGALRSAFLAKSGLNTEGFVGSNAVIALLVDLTRITVYTGLFAVAGGSAAQVSAWPLVVAGAAAAFCGVMLGKRYLHKVTMHSVRLLVGAMLFGVGFALLTGLL